MNDAGVAARWRSLAPYLLSLLRIVAAWLFLQYGTTKLFELPASMEAVGAQRPDVPYDSPRPLYPFGFGRSYR